MENFIKKHWDKVLAASFALVVGFSFVQSIGATESNPTLAQTDAKRNVNYIRVHNQDLVAHTAGQVMVFVRPQDATYPGMSVSTTTTASLKRVAGVVPYGETLKANSWGRVQVYGYHPAVAITGAVVVGDYMGTSATAGTGKTEVIVSTAGIFGNALDSSASSSTLKVLIRAQ